MPQQVSERNPFMLMLNPEVILAAVEKSERLGMLNRRLCRPLDRAAGAAGIAGAATEGAIDDQGSDEGEAPLP